MEGLRSFNGCLRSCQRWHLNLGHVGLFFNDQLDFSSRLARPRGCNALVLRVRLKLWLSLRERQRIATHQMERFIRPRGISNTSVRGAAQGRHTVTVAAHQNCQIFNQIAACLYTSDFHFLHISTFFLILFFRICPLFESCDPPVQTNLVDLWKMKLALKSTLTSP